MDRLTDADPDGRMAYWRQYNVEGASVRGEDDDLMARIDAEGHDIDLSDTTTPGIFVDRRDREHVAYYQDADGTWQPMRLKRDDDVVCCGMPMRVLGPCSGRGNFYGYYHAWFGEERIPLEAAWITERAPADPADLPDMPIIPDAEEPEPDEEQQP
jgi:hypothetical protein